MSAHPPAPDAPDAPDADVVDLDAALLKAVAHPLRARLLAALRTDGPATASGLAERFGTNSGQTSYHLRVLHGAQLVAEDPDRGTARERWWRAVHRASRIEPASYTGDRGAVERYRWLQAEMVPRQDRQFYRWLDDMEAFGDDWIGAASASDWMLRLTPAELRSLTADVEQVIRRYLPADADATTVPGPGDDGSERVLVFLRAFPARELDLS